jgi:hypothetical protein
MMQPSRPPPPAPRAHSSEAPQPEPVRAARTNLEKDAGGATGVVQHIVNTHGTQQNHARFTRLLHRHTEPNPTHPSPATCADFWAPSSSFFISTLSSACPRPCRLWPCVRRSLFSPNPAPTSLPNPEPQPLPHHLPPPAPANPYQRIGGLTEANRCAC